MAKSGVYSRYRRGPDEIQEKKKPVNQQKTLNVKEVSDILKCSISYVYDLFTRGEITGYRSGVKKGISIFESSVKKYISNKINDYQKN